jgi:hypothetical protein
LPQNQENTHVLSRGKPSKNGPRKGGATVGERQESVRNVRSRLGSAIDADYRVPMNASDGRHGCSLILSQQTESGDSHEDPDHRRDGHHR